MSTEAVPVVFAADRSVKPASASFVSHAKLISVLTLISRVLGMARESVAALYFGAGPVWSAFTVAFKIPNLFRKLLGEGALSAAFIPLYAQAIKAGDRDQANHFAAAGVSLLATLLLALTLVGELALLATAALARLRPEDLLIVKLTAIMLPYVLLICGTAFLGGILQVHKRFGLPAVAPVLLNVIHIAVIVVGARLLMLRGAHGAAREEIQTRLAYWLAAFVLVAGVLQVGLLVPALRAVGFRFFWVGRFWTPAVKKMLTLSVPVALSAGVLQVSVLIDTGISVYLTRGENTADRLHWFGRSFDYPMAIGAVARLNWAQFLYQFPLGVFAIALATAIFPTLSADALDADRGRFKAALRHGVVATLMEGLPASLGLILVRYPAIRLLFQHGSFTADDTRWVAMSTVFYASAIWAFSLQQILNRAYYALHDTLTPLVMAVVTIVVNTAVEAPLVFTRLGESGMAAGTLASFALQAVVMLWMLDRRVEGLGLGDILRSSAKMLAGCAVMAAACWGVQRIPGYPHGQSSMMSLAQLMILMTTGAAAYVAACSALGLSVRQSLFPKRAKA